MKIQKHFPYDVREFDNETAALKRLEDALDIIQSGMHSAKTQIEQLDPKMAIELLKDAANASRQAIFVWLWLKDRAASNNGFNLTPPVAGAS